jgi:uroporphyrinogen-III synthase
VVPHTFAGSSLAAAMAATAPLAGARVLWPRAEGARDELAMDLRAAGARLDAPVAYRTIPLPHGAGRLAGLVAAGEIDVVTFAAPSAVRVYAGGGGSAGRAVIAVIGPSTAAAVLDAGMPVHVAPEEHTVAALVDALHEFLRPCSRPVIE